MDLKYVTSCCQDCCLISEELSTTSCTILRKYEPINKYERPIHRETQYDEVCEIRIHI